MKSIWKYPVTPDMNIEMPVGAQILSIQDQRGAPQMWALVDPSAPTELRHFKVYGTGHECPDNPGRYIATFQMNGGTFIFHAFEQPNPKLQETAARSGPSVSCKRMLGTEITQGESPEGESK